MHYGEGACNIVSDVKDFYAENIRSSVKVRCQFIEFREGTR